MLEHLQPNAPFGISWHLFTFLAHKKRNSKDRFLVLKMLQINQKTEQWTTTKYRSLITDKNMEGYKGWKPDQPHSSTRISFVNDRRYCFTTWEGWHNLKLNLIYSTCIQSFKNYIHPVPFLLLWKIDVLKSLLFLIYRDLQEKRNIV